MICENVDFFFKCWNLRKLQGVIDENVGDNELG